MGKVVSTTQRTLKKLRSQGRVCAVAEKFNPHVGPHGIRQDLFGFIDIVVLDREDGIVAIQTCGRAGRPDHERKILACADAKEWLECGGRIELWSWKKSPEVRGSKRMIWKLRVDLITIDMFTEEEEAENE